MATVDYTFLTFLLKQIDKRNYNYIDSLTDEQLKQVQPFTLLRWFSCVPDASGLSIYQLLSAYSINKNYNASEKRLFLKLLCSAGIQRELKHKWIAPVVKKKSPKKSKKWEKIKELLELNDIETDIIFNTYSNEEITQLFHTFGFQDSDINKL